MDMSAQPAQILALRGADRDIIQDLLAQMAARWMAQGDLVLGVVEHVPPGAPPETVMLRDLATGALHPLNQDLGPGSAGCSLDPAGLAAACAGVEAAIASAATSSAATSPAGAARHRAVIVILSKFGRQEAEGRGLTHAFHAAVAADLPVLTSVSPTVAAAWVDFAGPLADFAPPDAAAIAAWWDRTRPAAEAMRDAGAVLGATSL